MATQTIIAQARQGLTLTMELFTVTGIAVVDSGAASLLDATRPTTYKRDFTDLPAGDYFVQLKDGTGQIKATAYVRTTNSTATFPAIEIPEGIAATLTSILLTPMQIIEGMNGGTLVIKRGSPVDVTFTMGDITGATKVWIAGKQFKTDPLGAEVFKVNNIDGITVSNKVALDSGDYGNGSLVVNDYATGECRLQITSAETAKYAEMLTNKSFWAAQALIADETPEPVYGRLKVELDIVQETS